MTSRTTETRARRAASTAAHGRERPATPGLAATLFAPAASAVARLETRILPRALGAGLGTRCGVAALGSDFLISSLVG